MSTSRSELEKRLAKAGSVEEVKTIVEGHNEKISDEDAKILYNKIKSVDKDAVVELSVNELDAVSGGNRDYMKDGCKATVEVGSNCLGNDYCALFTTWYIHQPEETCPKCGRGMGWSKSGSLYHIIKCPNCGHWKEISDPIEDL